jgi:hypothetical protein
MVNVRRTAWVRRGRPGLPYARCRWAEFVAPGAGFLTGLWTMI